LNDSFVILDEAQNTTSEQMKMFVTRLGFNSKAVITGDITQIDLPNARRSGLLEAIDVLQKVDGLTFAYFDEGDVSAINWCSASFALMTSTKIVWKSNCHCWIPKTAQAVQSPMFLCRPTDPPTKRQFASKSGKILREGVRMPSYLCFWHQ
jgi:hypothetical protein